MTNSEYRDAGEFGKSVLIVVEGSVSDEVVLVGSRPVGSVAFFWNILLVELEFKSVFLFCQPSCGTGA